MVPPMPENDVVFQYVFVRTAFKRGYVWRWVSLIYTNVYIEVDLNQAALNNISGAAGWIWK